MKHTVDYSIYLVTDRQIAFPRQIEEVIKFAVRGGITVVQLREKECSTQQFIELAKKVKKILIPLGIPLIINDRIDVALAVGAHGVHIGQSDMSYYEARRLMGSDAIIGLSVETMEQAIEAEKLDVDYLGVSPIFSTPTKTDTTTEWGIEGLRSLRLITQHTLVAIGGINTSNAYSVMQAGADGLAVVSAICGASDPEWASKRLRSIINQAQLEREGLKK